MGSAAAPKKLWFVGTPRLFGRIVEDLESAEALFAEEAARERKVWLLELDVTLIREQNL